MNLSYNWMLRNYLSRTKILWIQKCEQSKLPTERVKEISNVLHRKYHIRRQLVHVRKRLQFDVRLHFMMFQTSANVLPVHDTRQQTGRIFHSRIRITSSTSHYFGDWFFTTRIDIPIIHPLIVFYALFIGKQFEKSQPLCGWRVAEHSHFLRAPQEFPLNQMIVELTNAHPQIKVLRHVEPHWRWFRQRGDLWLWQENVSL